MSTYTGVGRGDRGGGNLVSYQNTKDGTSVSQERERFFLLLTSVLNSPDITIMLLLSFIDNRHKRVRVYFPFSFLKKTNKLRPGYYYFHKNFPQDYNETRYTSTFIYFTL